MNKKQISTMKRRDTAAHLTHLAMRLQRAREENIPGILREADETLQRYKLLKIIEDQPQGDTIDPTVADQATMEALAQVIRENVTPYGFALLVFSTSQEQGQRTNYVSNCNQDDICKAMAEFIAACEADKS